MTTCSHWRTCLHSPCRAARESRCPDTFRGWACEEPAGHGGFHRAGATTWAFRDLPLPEWRRRAEAMGLGRGLVAVKETNG
jgi:hypothetical protein